MNKTGPRSPEGIREEGLEGKSNNAMISLRHHKLSKKKKKTLDIYLDI